jgi:hypothetical protein
MIIRATYDCRGPNDIFWAVEFEVKIGDTRMIALDVRMNGACPRRVLVSDPLNLFFQAIIKRDLKNVSGQINCDTESSTFTLLLSPSSSDGSSSKPTTARYTDSKDPGPKLGPAVG